MEQPLTPPNPSRHGLGSQRCHWVSNTNLIRFPLVVSPRRHSSMRFASAASVALFKDRVFIALRGGSAVSSPILFAGGTQDLVRSGRPIRVFGFCRSLRPRQGWLKAVHVSLEELLLGVLLSIAAGIMRIMEAVMAVMVACSGAGLATHNLLCMLLVSWVPRSMGGADYIWIQSWVSLVGFNFSGFWVWDPGEILADFNSFFKKESFYAGLQHFFSYGGLVHITLYKSRAIYTVRTTIACSGEQYILLWDEGTIDQFSRLLLSLEAVLVGLILKSQDHDNGYDHVVGNYLWVLGDLPQVYALIYLVYFVVQDQAPCFIVKGYIVGVVQLLVYLALAFIASHSWLVPASKIVRDVILNDCNRS